MGKMPTSHYEAERSLFSFWRSCHSYAVAICVPVVALLLRHWLAPRLGISTPYILFFPAIAVSAFYGGLRSGLLATILSAAVAWHFLLMPSGSAQTSITVSSTPLFSLLIFFLGGVLISALNESLHRAHRRVMQHMQQLQKSYYNFAFLVDSVQDYAIFMLDVNGYVETWNQGAQYINGYTADEIVGQHFSRFYPLEDVESGKPEMELTVATKEGRFKEEGWRVRKDGSRFWASTVITAMRDEEGKLRGFAKVTRDITERRETQETLRRTEQQLQAVLDNTSVSVYIKDCEGRYVFVNRGFEQAYGRSRSEILGRTDGELSTPEFAEAFRAHDRRIMALQEPIVIEEDVKTYDGRPISYLSSKFPLRDGTGQAYAVCGISTDITERKKAEQRVAQLLVEEQEARAKAETANRAKDEFLSVLSHELRTPLTSIIGWISFMRQGKLDPELTAKGLETIERNANVQARLIEDLLDVSRIISGKLHLDNHPVNLASLVEQSVNDMHPMAKSKGVQLEAQIDLLSGLIMGDAVRLGQALRNLLGNALKFTAAGGQVSVQLTRQAEFAQITVSDTGEGIDPETLQVIFDRFRQEDGSATRQHGGLGLGLAIVRHLIEAHGGTVKAESAGKGQGATFTVQLPLTTLETLEASMHERRDQASQADLETDLEPVNNSNFA